MVRNRMVLLVIFLLALISSKHYGISVYNFASYNNYKCDNNEIRKIKSTDEYEYKIGKNVGYKIWEAGEISTISGIIIWDDKIYLCDQVQDNLKKIDIATGKMTVGPRIKLKETDFISDIIKFNNKIYCLTIDQWIIICDKSMVESARFKTTDLSSLSIFFYKSGDSLSFYISTDDILVTIDKNNRFRADSNNSLWKGEKGLYNSERGKEFSIKEKAGFNVLETEFGDFEVPENFKPRFIYEPWRFDFDGNKVASFEVDEKRLKVIIWEYE